MNVCLNPHQHHSAASSAQGYLLCPVPKCGFLLEGAIIERWRITALLKSGFSADLYLATAMQEYATPPLRVVVKVPRISAPVPSWQIEQLLALHHPYIHPLQQIGRIQSRETLYFLSPYEELGSLVRYLRPGKPLPLPFVADVVRQIAEALHYAHKQRVVHGRLKPENCLLAGPVTLQVADFYHTLFGTQESQISSPFFMAPEQLQGLAQRLSQTLPASDQYALAVIAYQLLSGKLPFTASHPAAILAQQIHNLLRPLSSLRPDLPSSVDDTLKRALSMEIDARFPNILSFAAALETALQANTGSFSNSLTVTGYQMPSRIPVLTPPRSLNPSSGQTQRGEIPPAAMTSLCLLPGHTSAITRLCWASDGVHLASAGPDRSVRLWQIRQKIGTPQATLTGHNGEILALSWTADSTLLASAASDATIRIWFIQPDANGTPQNQAAWWGHDGRVRTLSWSPDGRRLASGGTDRTIRQWDQTGKTLIAWQAHGRGGVTALAWSPNGRVLASGGADRQIIFWDTTTSRLLFTSEGHSDEILHLSWSPDGTMLASSAGKKDSRIFLWNPSTGLQVASFSGHTGEIVGLLWASNSTWLATASADRTLRFWNTRQPGNKQIGQPLPLKDTPLSMAGHSESGLLALGLSNMLVQVEQLAFQE